MEVLEMSSGLGVVLSATDRGGVVHSVQSCATIGQMVSDTNRNLRM